MSLHERRYRQMLGLNLGLILVVVVLLTSGFANRSTARCTRAVSAGL